MRASAWHYGIVSDPTSNVLFGADGTEVPDPSGRAGWLDAPGFPPLPLPAIPDSTMTREAVAAALDADSSPPAEHDHAVEPAQRPSAPPNGAPPADAPAQPAEPLISTLALPSHRPTDARLRPPVAGGSRTAMVFGEPRRRRVNIPVPRVPLPTRSDGGAAVFFVIASIIFLVLAYSIIMGIVESIIRLFQ